MEVKIIIEEAPQSHLTGGGYAICNLDVFIDKSLDYNSQVEILIHEILENYNKGMSHDKVDELTSIICDALFELPKK